MIKIRKGQNIILVSKGTYETMFKDLGYSIVDETEEAKSNASSKNQNIVSETKKIQENIAENEKIDILSNNIDNLSKEEEKIEKNKSDNNETEKKENNLEKILGMLSENDKNNKKNNNRQTKNNKEEK